MVLQNHLMKKLFFAIFLLTNIIAKAQDCNLPSVHFDHKQVKIKQEFYTDIIYVAKFLKENPSKNIIITGWDTQELDIAIRRAEKAQEFMVENFHITCDRFETGAKVFLIKETKFPKGAPVDYICRRVDFECTPPQK